MKEFREHRLEDATDAELVDAARSAGGGDLHAFEILVRRHQDRVTANCRFLSNSPSDAPDLAQEVFVKAYFGLNRFEGRSSFRTWVDRININHCLNFVRARARPSFLDIDAPGVQWLPQLRREAQAERVLESDEERARVNGVLHELTDAVRVPLVLRDMDGLSYHEIAEQLDIGLSAVKMRIKRGRAEFRRRYEAGSESRMEGAGGGVAVPADGERDAVTA